MCIGNKLSTKMNILLTTLLLAFSLSFTSAFGNNHQDTAYIDNNGTIHARINSTIDSIAIERFINNTWIVDTIIDITISREFTYIPIYISGINKFRLRGLNTNYLYKDILKFRNGPSLGYGPIMCVNSFKLPDIYKYRLMDSEGRILKTGISDSVDLRGLKMGIYYLEYDNITKKFLKKDK
ncbi:MAG: hypothetical protein J7604_23115 [Sporocytophaga sp.]|uniref:hypothetical protein n=1 Tax=Sporocytophaga sp. TaxID=2231183 RepID=UPI001B124631|nr:hypothetical protein [Sporocytophaga sp.]MBO9703123.1 hypothetical protein [Sporocytophaga sp.]